MTKNYEYYRWLIFIVPMLGMAWLGYNYFEASDQSYWDNLVNVVGFYFCVAVLFFTGAFMQGKINRHLCFCFGILLIANYFIFYGLYSLLPGSSYVSATLGVLSVAPGYLYFQYRVPLYNWILNAYPNLGSVLKCKTTNLAFLFAFYYEFSMFNEIFYAVGMWGLAVYYDVPMNGYLSDFMHPSNMYFPHIYDYIQTLIDFIFSVILVLKCLYDRKRPDCVGLGRTLSHD